MRRWTWWESGLCLGAVSWLSVLLCRPLSVSSGYMQLNALLAKLLLPDYVNSQYLSLCGGIDSWLIGVLCGLTAAGFLGRRWPGKESKGLITGYPGLSRRGLLYRTVVGAAVMLFGARLAGGCTTGHLIGGLSLLSVSGLVFGLGVFVGGIPTAAVLRRGGSGCET